MKYRWMKAAVTAGIMMGVLAGISMPGTAQAQSKEQSKESKGWTLEPGRIIGGVSQESGARLMDPVVMDFDGDGIDDIIFGAPGMGLKDMNNVGSVYIIAGNKDLSMSGQRDTTYWSAFDWRFDGHVNGGQLGMALYTGDFNGDGKRDLAVAEPGQKGAVYIFYGGKKRERGIFDINDKNGADVVFYGHEPNSLFGVSGCVGDFNHDGIDDLVLSSVSHNSTYGNKSSQITIIPMRRKWDKAAYTMSERINGKTVFARPIPGNTRMVHACAAGDFNDDGLLDLALGLPLDSYQKQKATGSVTIIYQPHKYNGTIVDLGVLDEKVGIRIAGSQANAQFGYSLAAGDFTGDGRTNLAISAPNRLISGSNPEGAIYVMDNGHWPQKSGEQPDDLMLIKGSGGQFGYRLQSADINGDKRPDLVVSSPTGGQLSSGELSVWLGGPHFVESLGHSLRPDISVSGEDFMGFGIGSAFGDINGDGKIDAVARTTADPLQRNATGAYAVLNAFSDFPQSSTLTDNFLTLMAPSKGGGIAPYRKAVDLNGIPYDAWFSPKGLGTRSVICLTKAGRAGKEDIAISAPESCDYQIIGPEYYEIADFDFTPSPTLKPTLTISVPQMPVKKAVGFVSVIELPEEMPKSLVLNLNESTLENNARTYILSGEAPSGLGSRLEWRDMDGDGYADLIIGAPKRMFETDVSGSIFIVKGSMEAKNGLHELTGADVIQYEGFLNEQLGGDWQILDFNADGLLDMAISAKRSANASGEEYGAIYVVYGAGKRAPKVYSVRSPEVGALQILGAQSKTELSLIDQVYDLNGDGIDDLILISPNHRVGVQKEGAIYGLFSSKDRKSGTLQLSQTSLVNFALNAGRNERIVDARFIEPGGSPALAVATTGLLTGTGTTVRALRGTNRIFSGQHTTNRTDAALGTTHHSGAVRFMTVPGDDGKPSLWFVYPNDGLTLSGQGIAQKLRE